MQVRPRSCNVILIITSLQYVCALFLWKVKPMTKALLTLVHESSMMKEIIQNLLLISFYNDYEIVSFDVPLSLDFSLPPLPHFAHIRVSSTSSETYNNELHRSLLSSTQPSFSQGESHLGQRLISTASWLIPPAVPSLYSLLQQPLCPLDYF